jgi:hypothetical protein
MGKKHTVLIMKCDTFDADKITEIVKYGMDELNVVPSSPTTPLNIISPKASSIPVCFFWWVILSSPFLVCGEPKRINGLSHRFQSKTRALPWGNLKAP